MKRATRVGLPGEARDRVPASSRRTARAWGARRTLTAACVTAATIASLGLARPAVAAAPAEPGFYGIATSTDMTPRDFERLERANIGTVRFTLYWPAVHNQHGQRHYFHNVDNFVINATAAGIRLIPTLIGSPKSISENPFRPPIGSDSEREAWQDFVRATVQRYGPGGSLWEEVKRCGPGEWCFPSLPYRPITVWQAWNEPNLAKFWQPFPNVAEYAQLVRLTGEAVHGVDPGAQVLVGGIMPGRKGPPEAIRQSDFLAGLYHEPGTAEGFDGVGLNPYQHRPRGVRRLVRRAREVMTASGDATTPLWVTEVGWSTRGPRDSYLVTTRRGQARRLSSTLSWLAAKRVTLGLRLAGWFTYEDTSFPGCDWCPGAGLFNRKGKPKPAWRKYAKLAGGKP